MFSWDREYNPIRATRPRNIFIWCLILELCLTIERSVTGHVNYKFYSGHKLDKGRVAPVYVVNGYWRSGSMLNTGSRWCFNSRPGRFNTWDRTPGTNHTGRSVNSRPNLDVMEKKRISCPVPGFESRIVQPVPQLRYTLRFPHFVTNYRGSVLKVNMPLCFNS
jgi:hypothetical protein